MKFFEIMGFPGSGKSTFRKTFNFEKNINTLEYIFFQKIFIEDKNLNLFIFKIIFYFFNKKFYDFEFKVISGSNTDEETIQYFDDGFTFKVVK